MNVFIASGGRRTSLVTAFKRAARCRGGEVFVGDIDGLAPSLYIADRAVRVPKIQCPDYIPFLLKYVRDQEISLLVPTLDTELEVLAEARRAFRSMGCEVLVSDAQLVCITSDKWETVQTFGQHGIRVPASWLPDELEEAHLPERLFVKPRNGSASRHAYPVLRDALHDVLGHVPNAIVQEELRGTELTIDALLDLSGNPIHFVPRERIRTLGGESIQGVTIDDSGIRDWVVRVLEIIRLHGGRGPMTIQLFMTSDGPVLSEINPRFGGGFPLTYEAGGRYPDWLLQMRAGKSVAPCIGQYRAGLYMTRTYTERFVEQPLWK